MIDGRDPFRIWRVIDDGAGEAAWNMGMDEALLNAIVTNISPPSVRLYSWLRPSISLGRFQNIDRTLFLENCIRRDIPLVRRITGGRGILHGDDLTVCIAVPITALDMGDNPSIVSIYTKLAAGFLAAFHELRIEAIVGDRRDERVRSIQGDCFATISRADIVDASTGRKLLGSALHRRGNSILQQISIPLHSPERYREWHEISQCIFQGSRGLPEYSPVASIDSSDMREAIVIGLKSALGIESENMKFTDAEWLLATELARTH